MDISLKDYLICQKCLGELFHGENFVECKKCEVIYNFSSGIYHFVENESYSTSFGIQWNKFDDTQLDSKLGTSRSRFRFSNETGWTQATLDGKVVLDAGSGAGRFTEIALSFGANVISVDYSVAIKSSSKNMEGAGNLCSVQADLSQLPIKSNSIEFIYCIGVLQHTKSPGLIIKELMRVLSPNGTLVVTYYPKAHWYTVLHSKYLLRPITRRLPKKLLLRLIQGTSFFWFPITNRLFAMSHPYSKFFRFVIPIANYVEFEYLSENDHRNESVLDTFDMLSPRFDRPFTRSEILGFLNDQKEPFSHEFVNSNPGTIRIRKTV
jgi:ubiquinone/menaquinone biosynthesis C-methylase UbiE